MTKKRISVTILLAVVFLSFVWYVLKRPITSEDFVVRQNGNVTCYEPSHSLVRRCNLFKGELRNEVTAVGIGIFYTYGCYPKGATTDKGKTCKTSLSCQGDCRWFEGDVVTPGMTTTCTSYKSPYFVQESGDVALKFFRRIGSDIKNFFVKQRDWNPFDKPAVLPSGPDIYNSLCQKTATSQ